MGLPLQSQTETGVRRAEDQNASAYRRRKRVSNLRWTDAGVGLREAARRDDQLPQGRVRDSTHIMNKKAIRCNTIRKEAKAGLAQVVSA